MDDVKISIIMLLYNGRKFLLQKAVNSVVEQTYTNWELILQDDHSTDGTFSDALALALTDERIKIFRNEKNLGIVKNRAAAFKHTTGDLICHVDNDDSIYPHALATMAKEFKKSPEIGIAYSDTAYVTNSGDTTSYAVNKNYGGPMTDYGWRHLTMYRRSAYNQTKGYNEELESACEDGDLFMQIAEKFPFKRVPQVLYAYNNEGTHESSKKPECKECPSRGKCNFIRVWTAGLVNKEEKYEMQKAIAVAYK